MMDHEFDSSDWIERLAVALEDFDPMMKFNGWIGHWGRSLSYNEFRALLNSGNYRLVEKDSHQYWSFANLKHILHLIETRALVMSNPNELFNLTEFESLSMRLRHNPDLTGILSVLREHPIAHTVLESAGGGEGIRIGVPRGSSLLELKTLAINLVKLTIKTDGRNAAHTLDRFLYLGKQRELQGYEVTLFYGLSLNERVDIGNGAFIAPYENVEQACKLPKRITEMMARSSLPRKGESVTALVREFKWGTFDSTPEESQDLDWNIDYLFPCDLEVILNLLSVAIRSPLAARVYYMGADQWLEEIDRNFAFGWLSGGGHPYDGWWSEKQLSDEDKVIFQGLIHSWQEYKGNCTVLNRAVQRLATSYNRPGKQGVEDIILDCAIALEIMYELDGPELTYKLATRAGHFLGADAKERNAIFDNVKSLYKVRSAIVHGRKGVDRRDGPGEEIWEAVRNGKDLVRRTFFKLLSAKSPPDWNELVMTGSGF